MDKKRHAEIKGRTEDRLELPRADRRHAHSTRMAPDEAVFSDAAHEFLRRGLRILHRQESPGAELRITAGDRRSKGIVELSARRTARDASRW